MGSFLLIPFLASASLGDTHAQPAHDAASREGLGRPTAEARLSVLTGHVVRPDGRPASGARVSSSAGGEARVEEDGTFWLEVELPVDALHVGLSVEHDLPRGREFLRTEVGVGTLAGVNSAGFLRLERAGPCTPDWVPTFGAPPGPDGIVSAMEVFDDGSGPTLRVGGAFDAAGASPAVGVAAWDGTEWSPFKSDLGSGGVSDFEVFDVGNGPKLIVGGSMTLPSPAIPTKGILIWDGATWSRPSSEIVPMSGTAEVHALETFDDGSGAALYAGGRFEPAWPTPSSTLSRWDGASWTSLNAGIGEIRALVVHDDGTGAALYAGGAFRFVNSGPIVSVARWDGASWTEVGTVFDGPVEELGVFDDGSGPLLYAGGTFTSAGGVAATNVARWDGAAWSAVGGGIGAGSPDEVVATFRVFDDGSGASLFAGGHFHTAGGAPAMHVAKWDGTSWSPLGTGMNSVVRALTVFDDGSGAALYAGGFFTRAGGVQAWRAARWDGASWSALGNRIDTADNDVLALATYDDASGDGTELYAAGRFDLVGGAPAMHVARWDGEHWDTVGGGFDDTVHALLVFDDVLRSRPALYAGGEFSMAGGQPASCIAAWDGTSWSPLGAGVNGIVRALGAFDDGLGGGPALYAAGDFTTAGGTPAARIARWNGVSWSPLGSGTDGVVSSLAVFDDGGGPALFAGGFFVNAGGVMASRIARWNGTSWTPVGSGMIGGPVLCLRVFDDGSGPALYAGGEFSRTASGSVMNGIARWNGVAWSSLDGGMGNGGDVHALGAFDDGAGTALYAGGRFRVAGGMAAESAARWNGSAWSPLGGGVQVGPLRAFAVFDAGKGPDLYAGGEFHVSDPEDSFLARWNGCSAEALPSAPISTWVGSRRLR